MHTSMFALTIIQCHQTIHGILFYSVSSVDLNTCLGNCITEEAVNHIFLKDIHFVFYDHEKGYQMLSKSLSENSMEVLRCLVVFCVGV